MQGCVKMKEYKFIIFIFGFALLFVFGSIGMDTWGEAKERRIESYNDEELLLYKIKDTNNEATIKDLVEEYINEKSIEDDFKISELEGTFGKEDFNWIEEQYNDAIDKLYFDKNKGKHNVYDLIKVVEDAENGDDDNSSTPIESFMDIKRELLTSDIDKKLFTNETTKAIQLVEETNLAEELEWEKEREEEDIYEYMKNAYNQITNFGASYIPEVHDDQVAELASEKFGISTSEAGNIYVKMEMRGY